MKSPLPVAWGTIASTMLAAIDAFRDHLRSEKRSSAHTLRAYLHDVGELAVFATPLGASVIQLVHAEDAPLTEQQAAPLIEQFLAGRKRLETAAAEVKRLRELATIEYLGEFKRGN